MKRMILLIPACFFLFMAGAQKEDPKDYAKMKEELNERIFGAPDPFFKENKLPDEYKNESAVILAQKHSLESDSKYKFRIGFFSRSGVKFNFFDIFRRKLLINDQSALEEYSQFNFTRLQSKDWSPVGKLKNYTFINVRLIKPDGKIKTVNIDESAVTVKEAGDEKRNKIAIPDLSIGDIIDYYVANYYQEADDGAVTPLTYVLGDDYPILNYVISLQFDARIAAEYQCINGAPDFKITSDEDGTGKVLKMAVKNIPKIKGLMWSSAFRQLPIIRVNYKRGEIIRRDMTPIREGQVVKASTGYPALIETKMAQIMNSVCYDGAVYTRAYKEDRAAVKKAWDEYLAKHPKADHPDSIAAFVFRYINWNDYFGNFNLETNYNNAYYPADLKDQLYRISKFAYIMVVDFKTDLDFLVLPGNNSFERNNLFSVADLSVLVRTRGGRLQYFNFADNFEAQNSIPYYLQGESAKVFPFESRKVPGGKYLYLDMKETSTVKLPASDFKTNHEDETVNARLDASDPMLVIVNRKVNSTGYMKKDAQAMMTIYEEMAEQTGRDVGITDDLMTQHSKRSKTARKESDELATLLEKARTKHKEDFEREIERNYNSKARELKSYKILGFGMNREMPFSFEEEFSMEGWVKKAGNNYIVDIGKFIAAQIEIKRDQRERTKDVYMPFPRSFSYHIRFNIPEGYSVEGLDKLNTDVSNETGSFNVASKLEGKTLSIDITKHYSSTFEPVANWPLMLSFLDKALEFNQQKILLKKG